MSREESQFVSRGSEFRVECEMIGCLAKYDDYTMNEQYYPVNSTRRD